MFGSIGLALGAVSTISSLLAAAADGINKAATSSQSAGAPAPGVSSASPAPFSPAVFPSASATQSYGAANQDSVVLPKFDQHTQATLLAYQEIHRGG